MAIVEYNCTDEPTETGVYACRVTDPLNPDLLMDVFLMRMEGTWWYLRSDAKFRDTVHGWVGPLRRRLSPKT